MKKPFISVVMPSRNRPELLRLAVESVASQTFKDFEIVLVNDGSDEEYAEAMAELVNDYSDKIKLINLVRYSRGHGQSYSINTGVWNSQGEYCTFLDDDDFWTDPQHLEKAHAALTEFPNAEVYFTNQLAIEVGAAEGEVIWLGDLEGICQKAGVAKEAGIYKVDVELLMQSEGFSHLNTSIVKRELFDSIKGMDEDSRWECDRDFYLRVIDQANGILFNPDVISQHNVPDKSKASSMTTSISIYQRQNYQIYILNKAAMMAKHPLIVKHARDHKAYALQKVTKAMVEEGRFSDASYFARQVLFMTTSLRWPFYTAWVMLRALMSK